MEWKSNPERIREVVEKVVPPAMPAPVVEYGGGIGPVESVEHVHDWTVYPSGKRKCKPCGMIKRPGDAS